jgi:hypothetical protein
VPEALFIGPRADTALSPGKEVLASDSEVQLEDPAPATATAQAAVLSS